MALDSTLVPPFKLALNDAKTITGLAITATPAAGVMGLVVTNAGTTNGTSVLACAAANNATITAKALFDFNFPAVIHEGDSFAMTVMAKRTLAASATGTMTIGASVREINDSGVFGAELCSTGPINVTGTIDQSCPFVIDSTLIGVGDRVAVVLTATVIGTTTADVTGSISSIKFG